jgi:hypothetical protein
MKSYEVEVSSIFYLVYCSLRCSNRLSYLKRWLKNGSNSQTKKEKAGMVQ